MTSLRPSTGRDERSAGVKGKRLGSTPTSRARALSLKTLTSFRMIRDSLWSLSYSGAPRRCERAVAPDSFGILPVAPQLYRPRDFYPSLGNTKEEVTPGTPCNIKLLIFCLIKTLSRWWRVCFVDSISARFPKKQGRASDEYIRTGSPCPLLPLSSVQPHYKGALKCRRIYSVALSAVPKQLYSRESSNNVG